jgi:hypothetical protein
VACGARELTADDRRGGLPFRLGPSVIAGVGLSLALAGAIASPEGAPIKGVATRVFLPLPDWLIITAGAAFSIASLVLVAIVLAAGRRRRKSEDEYELSRSAQKTSPLVVVLLVLLALAPGAMMGGVLVWLALSDASVVPGPGGITLGDPGAYGPSPDEPPIMPASPLTTGLIGALALLAGLGSLGFVLWLCLAARLQPRPVAVEHEQAQLAAAVEESLDDLRREPDARAAILRIYRHFERALAGAAVPRRPWQTPTEFMRAVLSRLPLPASPVRSLTGLFEIARFSRHPLGEAERDSAWRSLTEIRATLDQPTEPHADPRS